MFKFEWKAGGKGYGKINRGLRKTGGNKCAKPAKMLWRVGSASV
jgi:hypothetical protein